MVAMAEELGGQKIAGATIHFTPENPLSRELIEKIVQKRMAESGFA